MAEKTFPGHLGIADDELSARASTDRAVYGNTSNGPGGLIGVWSDQNTRDSLFDAMQRKEVFGTSGPRIEPRFFGGWNLPGRSLRRPERESPPRTPRACTWART